MSNVNSDRRTKHGMQKAYDTSWMMLFSFSQNTREDAGLRFTCGFGGNDAHHLCYGSN